MFNNSNKNVVQLSYLSIKCMRRAQIWASSPSWSRISSLVLLCAPDDTQTVSVETYYPP